METKQEEAQRNLEDFTYRTMDEVATALKSRVEESHIKEDSIKINLDSARLPNPKLNNQYL